METNDNTELRELLSKSIKRLEHVTGCDMHRFHPDATSCDGKISTGECNHKKTCELIFEARKALAKPQRNCEVGTWQQQEKRFENFCNRFRHDYCRGCSLGEEFFENHEIGECRLAWAQKPYSGEVKDGSK